MLLMFIRCQRKMFENGKFVTSVYRDPAFSGVFIK